MVLGCPLCNCVNSILDILVKMDKDEDIVSIGTVKDFNGMKISTGTLKDGSEHVVVFNEELKKWVKSKSVDMYDVLRSPPWIEDEVK